MSATYVAWNAKSYPWPPPEGWYLASDEQWWAPGTGPNPPHVKAENTSGETTTSGDGGPGNRPPATGSSGAGAGTNTGVTPTSRKARAAMPTTATRSTTTQASMAARTLATSAAAASSTRATGGLGSTVAVSNDQPAAASASDQADPTGRAAADRVQETPAMIWQRPFERRGPSRRTGTVIGIGILMLAGAAGAIIGIATGENSSANETLPVIEAQATTTSTTSTTTTPPSTTIATAPETTFEGITNPELVAEYRARLDADGFSGEELTDADIAEFGSSFCVLALVAEDPESFELYRAEAIAENVGELSSDELVLAIDDAVSVFCPEQATKLGIS